MEKLTKQIERVRKRRIAEIENVLIPACKRWIESEKPIAEVDYDPGTLSEPWDAFFVRYEQDVDWLEMRRWENRTKPYLDDLNNKLKVLQEMTLPETTTVDDPKLIRHLRSMKLWLQICTSENTPYS